MSWLLHELSYPCNARSSIPMPTVFYPTIATIPVFTLLLLLLFYYCHHYKTVATDKPRVAELTTHLLRFINILLLPLCWINKFGFYFPRRLLRSPILVGHQYSLDRLLALYGLSEYSYLLVVWDSYSHNRVSKIIILWKYAKFWEYPGLGRGQMLPVVHVASQLLVRATDGFNMICDIIVFLYA
jgi:hypothetical protein